MKSPLRNGFLRLSVACAAVLALAVPSAAQALPEGYAYEKISPADKGNGEVAGGALPSGFKASSDGELILYPADGVFAGATGFPTVNAYVGTRGTETWITTATNGMVPFVPPSDLFFDPGPGTTAPSGFADSKTVVQTNVDPETGDPIPAAVFILDLRTGESERISPAPTSGPPHVHLLGNGGGADAVQSDPDFSHVYFSADAALVAEADGVVPEHPKLYSYADGDTQLASYLPDGTPFHGKPLTGLYGATVGAGPNPVSDDGEVFWWGTGNFNSPPRPNQLFRGEIGVQSSSFINESENTNIVVPPGPADFKGASADGQRAVFTTNQQLTDDAPANALKYYLYTHSEDPENDENLTLISVDNEPADGENASSSTLLGVSDDADVVYFSSNNQLVPGEPTASGTKLYRWELGAGLEYITTLSGGGSLQAYRPGTTADGDTLAIRSSASNLTADDNGGHGQLYLYDAVGGDWECASCRPSGPTSSAVGAEPFYSFNRVTSQSRRWLLDDGRVFFETAEPIAQLDANGKVDIYTYKDGQVDLISSGRATADVKFADASADGSSIFFASRDRIVPWDTDNKADLYVARLGGGLPVPDAGEGDIPCTGDECQGPADSAPVQQQHGSEGYEGKGNTSSPDCGNAARKAQQARQKARRLKGKTSKVKQRARKAKGTPKAKRLRRKAKRARDNAQRAKTKSVQAKRKLAQCRRAS